MSFSFAITNLRNARRMTSSCFRCFIYREILGNNFFGIFVYLAYHLSGITKLVLFSFGFCNTSINQVFGYCMALTTYKLSNFFLIKTLFPQRKNFNRIVFKISFSTARSIVSNVIVRIGAHFVDPINFTLR